VYSLCEDNTTHIHNTYSSREICSSSYHTLNTQTITSSAQHSELSITSSTYALACINDRIGAWHPRLKTDVHRNITCGAVRANKLAYVSPQPNLRRYFNRIYPSNLTSSHLAGYKPVAHVLLLSAKFGIPIIVAVLSLKVPCSVSLEP
jgi:hypothetical protein